MYDDAGNITSVTDAHAGAASDGTNASGEFAYDVRNRLTTSTVGGFPKYFRYDALGNLIGRDLLAPSGQNQVYNTARPHQLASALGWPTFAYDGDGNLTQKGTSRFLRYDSENRLACAATTQASANGGCNGSVDDVGFSYDVDGSRIIAKAGTPTANSTDYFFGEWFEWTYSNSRATIHIAAFGKRIASKTITSTSLRAAGLPTAWPLPISPRGLLEITLCGLALALLVLAHASGVTTRLLDNPARVAVSLALVVFFVAPSAWAAPPGGGGGSVTTRQWIFTDHLGSGVLTVNDQGGIIQRRLFEPFGRVVGETQPTESTARLFTGKRHDARAGMYDFRARWYDADTGRFASIDPIIQSPGDPQTLNAYTYVGNNPVNHIDPDGLGFFKWLKKAAKKVVHAVKQVLHIVIAVVITAVSIIAPAVGLALAFAYSAINFAINPTFMTAFGLAVSVLGIGYSLAGSVMPGAGMLKLLGGDGGCFGAAGFAMAAEVSSGSATEANALSVAFYKQRSGGSRYENFGNFNYGATARALGLSHETILRGAGAAQLLAWRSDHFRNGTPLGGSPYGDNPEDQPLIEQGIEYYDRHWGPR